MSISILSNLVITDQDIDEIEKLLGNVKFDDQRRKIIKCMDTKDIQAFPGSGKTTVLISKLAILAKKWPYSNKGICVLSHTNAARDEIELRLGHTNIGKALLSYPHFIGTFHSFFDTFIGLPWLRSSHYPVKVIDKEIVLKRRFSRLKRGTQYYFEHHKLSQDACESTSFPIQLNIKCGNQSDSYRDLYSCIEQSFSDGYFTFNEMLYISRYALQKQKDSLPQAIQTRFPLLLIDEAQDTLQIQWELLNTAFSDNCKTIRQAFGDQNQAIYQSYLTNNSITYFPQGEYLSISNSHRFGRGISHLVSPLEIGCREEIQGDYSKFSRLDHSHTIFLFENPSAVLPSYGEYLLSVFSDQELSLGLDCYAIGMVHNKEIDQKNASHFPEEIRDYWPQYDPCASSATYKPKYFIEYFRRGIQLSTGQYNAFVLVECISEGLRKYLVFTGNSISTSGYAFHALIQCIPQNLRTVFRHEMLSLTQHSIKTQSDWNNVIEIVKNIIRQYLYTTVQSTKYFEWIDDKGASSSVSSKNNTDKNIYSYADPKTGRSVNIHLSSIHAVKGRTHLATLVLDTFWHKRNMEAILPWMYCQPNKKDPKNNPKRVKCAYVGLTRARALICVAIPKSSVSENQRELLINMGWRIQEI